MKKLILLTVGAALAVCIVLSLYFYRSFVDPISHEPAVFVVNAGAPVSLIAKQLAGAGIIVHPKIFSYYSRLIGADKKIKAGEYEFESGLSNIDVLQKMLDGKFKLYKLTIIEGWNLAQISQYLSTQDFVSQNVYDEFVASINDPEFLKKFGVLEKRAEGYLYPDTYLVQRPRTGGEIASIFLAEFNKHWTPAFDARAAELGMTRQKVITLASIVEKETGAEEERPLIASVFYNRLKIGMPLQSDPTVIYSIKDYDGNIRRSDLSIDNPYNTYKYGGLPPGPIASPGLKSITAALWPAQTPYLYFVSRNDGTHEFNVDYPSHLKAVNKFQKKM